MTGNLKRLATLLILGMPILNSNEALRGQTQPAHTRSIIGAYDKQVAYPQVEGTPGQKDKAAIAELQQFLAISTPLSWKGIDAAGTLMIGDGKVAREYAASLSLERGDKYRLDIHAKEGLHSLRRSEYAGGSQDARGNVIRSRTGRSGGPIVIAEQLWDTARATTSSVIDDGDVEVDGRSLHKVTVSTTNGISHSRAGLLAGNAMSLYFDPVTHILTKTAAIAYGFGPQSGQYLQVITYSDYRQVEGVLVPFQYAESDNGQLTMTFKATQISVSSGHDNSYFQF
jgi:hypothetical protein